MYCDIAVAISGMLFVSEFVALAAWASLSAETAPDRVGELPDLKQLMGGPSLSRSAVVGFGGLARGSASVCMP